MFLYQPKFSALQLRKDKGIDYVLSWKPKVFFCYILFFIWHKTNRYKTGIKFDKDPLVVERNNYTAKIVNAYIVYNLDTWPKIPLETFTLNNGLFGKITTTLVIKVNGCILAVG